MYILRIFLKLCKMFIEKSDLEILRLCEQRFEHDVRSETYNIPNMTLIAMWDYPEPEIEDGEDIVKDFVVTAKKLDYEGDEVDDETIRRCYAWCLGRKEWQLWGVPKFRNYQIFNDEHRCQVYIYPERSRGNIELTGSDYNPSRKYATDDFQLVLYFRFVKGRELPFLEVVGVTHEDCSMLGSPNIREGTPYPTGGETTKAARKNV